MMVVDASALCAILLQELEATGFSDRIEAAPERQTHAISVYETVAALMRVTTLSSDEALATVTRFMDLARIELIPIGRAEMATAVAAMSVYGRGRHPARLNMGDCFSYAVAKLRAAPLLYKGDDFSRTDLA